MPIGRLIKCRLSYVYVTYTVQLNDYWYLYYHHLNRRRPRVLTVCLSHWWLWHKWEKTCLIDAPGSFGDFYVWAPPAYIMFWTLLLWMYQDPGHLTLYGITLLDFLLFCEYVLSFSVQNSQYRSPWYLFKFPGESVAMETMLVVW